MLAHQRELLQYIPAWLRFRGLGQKDIALHLGVSEASVSKWLSGGDAMKVGALQQIAVLLQADPGDLLTAPPAAGLQSKVRDLLDAAEGMTGEQLAHLTETARFMTGKPKP